MRSQMKLMRRITVTVATVLMLLMTVATAVAVEPVPLPDFQLTAADGSVVKSSTLPTQGNWLIVYVQPRNQFSDNLLKLFKKEQYPALAQHAVIIVAGSTDDMKTAQVRFPELA